MSRDNVRGPSDRPGTPRIVQRPATERGVCRCGTRFGRHESRFGVVDVPASLRGILDGQTFCSLSCVRAFFLETLSELDRIDTPFAESVVTDLRATYLQLASAYLAFLAKWNPGQTPGS